MVMLQSALHAHHVIQVVTHLSLLITILGPNNSMITARRFVTSYKFAFAYNINVVPTSVNEVPTLLAQRCTCIRVSYRLSTASYTRTRYLSDATTYHAPSCIAMALAPVVTVVATFSNWHPTVRLVGSKLSVSEKHQWSCKLFNDRTGFCIIYTADFDQTDSSTRHDIVSCIGQILEPRPLFFAAGELSW